MCTGLLTVAVDLAYLGFTAYLFFSMRTNILASTDYKPAPVLVSTAMLCISLALVLLVGIITMLTKRRGDRLYLRHFGALAESESRKSQDPEKEGNGSGFDEIPKKLSNTHHHPYESDEAEARSEKLEDWLATFQHETFHGKEEANVTVDEQMEFIKETALQRRNARQGLQQKDYDPSIPLKKRQPGDIVAPNPHDEFHTTTKPHKSKTHGLNAMSRLRHYRPHARD